MSLVSSRLSLTHRCTIERDANAATANARGNPQSPSWQPNLTGLPCRLWTTAGREAVDNTTIAVVEDMRLLLPLGTDVTEHDRVGDVTQRGTVIAAGPIGIRAVLTHQDHLELVLVKVT